MSALLDLIVATTDPVTAVLLVWIVHYTRGIREDLREDLQETRERVERLEAELIDSPSR
jgi:hypothetical protein